MFKTRYTVLTTLAMFTILGCLMPQKLIIESQATSEVLIGNQRMKTAPTIPSINAPSSSISLLDNKVLPERPINKLILNSDSAIFKFETGNATRNPSLENRTLPKGGATTTPGIHIATLDLTPASAGTGSKLIVAGLAFGKDQNVTLTIDSRPFDANQTIVTDANGEFIVIVTVPLDITPGNHSITAKDDSSVEASATLAVTKTPGRQ